MKNSIIGLILASILVLATFSAIILYNQWPVIAGNKIVLAARISGSSSFFGGRYLYIDYEISRLENFTGFSKGDTIFVSLVKDAKGIWGEKGASKSRPESEDFIRGDVSSISSHSDVMMVKYGIEQLPFNENAELPQGNITAEISIASSGRAKLIQLLQNGKPLEIEYAEFDIKS